MSKNAVLTEYRIFASEISAPVTIALAADVHERPADDIIEIIRKSKPDLIAVAGDTLERYSGDRENHIKRSALFTVLRCFAAVINGTLKLFFGRRNKPLTENAYRFLSRCSDIAPVFMSLGNHEEELTAEDYDFLKKNNIKLLDNSYGSFTVKNMQLLIGGYSFYGEHAWFDNFARENSFKILLCHRPEIYDEIRASNVNLVLAGHNHGGQFRLFGRGLVSSSGGFFPRYDKGVYENRLVVTAGCSNSVYIPRINNPREAVIIKLIPK